MEIADFDLVEYHKNGFRMLIPAHLTIHSDFPNFIAYRNEDAGPNRLDGTQVHFSAIVHPPRKAKILAQAYVDNPEDSAIAAALLSRGGVRNIAAGITDKGGKWPSKESLSGFDFRGSSFVNFRRAYSINAKFIQVGVSLFGFPREESLALIGKAAATIAFEPELIVGVSDYARKVDWTGKRKATSNIKIFAGFGSFVFGDSFDDCMPSLDPDMEMLAVKEGNTITVFTQAEDFIKVRVELREDPPPSRIAQWDHIVDGGIDVPSGVIVVDNDTAFDVEPGGYRFRAHFGNLAAGRDIKGTERYKISFWPGEPMDLARIKAFIEY